MLYALIPLHCPRAHAYIENCSKYALLFLNCVFLHRLTSSQNALRFIVYLVASLYCFKCLVRCDFPWIWFPVFISRMWCPVWALPVLPTSPLYYCASSYQCGFPSFHLGRLSSSLHPHGLAWCLVLRVRRHKAKEYVSLESKTFVDGHRLSCVFAEAKAVCIVGWFSLIMRMSSEITLVQHCPFSLCLWPCLHSALILPHTNHFEDLLKWSLYHQSPPLPSCVSLLARANFLRTYLTTSFLLFKALRVPIT